MPATVANSNQVYRQHNPKETPLYKIVEQYFDEFKAAYAERFQEKYGYWRSAIDHAVEAYLECGIYECGFAHIRCEDCGHEMIVPFSCKGRCFCPSCQQKRAIWWSEWLVEEVLEPVPHRQLVFTIPKILRGYFLKNRHLLSDLAQCAWLSLKEFVQSIHPDALAGAIICIQTFGNLLNFQPHLHAIIPNGYFVDGQFHCLSDAYITQATQILPQIFRNNVIEMLRGRNLLSEELARTILNFRHNSGFSVHNEVLIQHNDHKGLENLAHYCLRNPISLDKIFLSPNGTVYYHSKSIHPGYKGNFRIFSDPLEFLAEALQHIPPKGFQMVRYYGDYSNVIRARKRRQIALEQDLSIETPYPEIYVPRSVRKAWARLIHKIYEADPMVCPICGAKMKIQKIVDKPSEIYSTLAALGIPSQPRGQPHHHDSPGEIASNLTDYIIIPDGEPFSEEQDFSSE